MRYPSSSTENIFFSCVGFSSITGCALAPGGFFGFSGLGIFALFTVESRSEHLSQYIFLPSFFPMQYGQSCFPHQLQAPAVWRLCFVHLIGFPLYFLNYISYINVTIRLPGIEPGP